MSVGTRTISGNGLEVSALGLGCMGMSQSYGPSDEDEAVQTINTAIDAGVTLIDTADVYGAGDNERLVGRAIAGRRDEIVLASKFSIRRENGKRFIDGRPENVVRCCNASLERLGVDHIDLYYQHRVDPQVPIEETVGAMAGLVDEGKVRYLGLSDASARSVERAAAVHPIAALQTEWSIWTREIEDEVLPAARRHGIGIVTYGPLGRGFLTGTITDTGTLADGDSRRNNPRFQEENFAHNLELVERFGAIATGKGCTSAQLALAWVMAQGPDVVPIPGTKRRKYLAQNVAAADVELTAGDLAEIEALLPRGSAWGDRRAATGAYGDSPALSTR